MSLSVRYWGLTHVGRQRHGNEDAFLTQPPLFAVADGMGGARAGEVASRMAVETLAELGDCAGGTPQDLLATAIAEANARIFAAGEQDRSRSGMGTTLTVLLLCGSTGHIAHIGDSRAYLLREDVLEQITEDHSLVAEMVREGRLPADAAASHPYRSVLSRALGTEAHAEVDHLEVDLRAGDVLLLCSDGLSGPVSDEKLRKALALPEPERSARKLIDEALHGGGPDNITVVVVRLGEPEAEMEEAAGEDVSRPATKADSAGATAAEGAADAPGSASRRRWRWRRGGGP